MPLYTLGMETIVSNISGATRRERLYGRDFLVAPVSMIVPGVLAGSGGPILYDLPGIKNSVYGWNGMPLVKDHPMDDQGRMLSARTPEILRERGLGFVFNAMAEDKLAAEAWFDIERTRMLAPLTLQAVESGKQIEISTGLNLAAEPSKGVWNKSDGTSVNYEMIAHNYRPDHLAIITEGVGACGIKDGCGVHNKATDKPDGETDLLQKTLEKAIGATPSAKGDTTVNTEETNMALKPAERTTIIDRLVANCDCWKGKKEDLEKTDDTVLSALNKGLDNEEALTIANADMAALKKAAAAKKAKAKPAADEEEEEKPVGNAAAPAKVEIKEEDLPESIRRDLAYGRQQRIANRKQLITKLVGNIKDDEERKAATKDYMDENEWSDSKLQKLVDRFASNVQQDKEEDDWVPSYIGAGAGGFGVTNNDGFKPTPMPAMEIDYADIAKQS